MLDHGQTTALPPLYMDLAIQTHLQGPNSLVASEHSHRAGVAMAVKQHNMLLQLVMNDMSCKTKMQGTLHGHFEKAVPKRHLSLA